jgi:hypothetical protein
MIQDQEGSLLLTFLIEKNSLRNIQKVKQNKPTQMKKASYLYS